MSKCHGRPLKFFKNKNPSPVKETGFPLQLTLATPLPFTLVRKWVGSFAPHLFRWFAFNRFRRNVPIKVSVDKGKSLEIFMIYRFFAAEGPSPPTII